MIDPTSAILSGALVVFLAMLGLLAVRYRAPAQSPEVADLEARVWRRAAEQGERLESEIDALRREVRDIRQENDELRAWVVELTQQVVGLGGKPVPRPHLHSIATAPTIDALYDCLRTRFDLDELRGLAFEAGLQPGSIAGDTVPAYALRLYEQAERTGRTAALAEAVRKARPGVVT